MIRNPELRRNLWLEFTANRLVIGPILLVILFVVAGAADWKLSRMIGGTLRFPIMDIVARWGFLATVLLWGGRQAAGAVIREIRNRTWDGQRMSAVGPWTMTVGKLIGATAYSWLLGLCCLAVHVAVGAQAGALGPVLVSAATMVGFGLVCQTVGLLLSLTRVSRTPGFRPGNITLIHFVALGATLALFFAARTPGWFDIDWWGLDIDNAHFVAMTAWFFALWGVVGINRRMRIELHFHNTPLVWFAFLAVFVAYTIGLAHGSPLPGAVLGIAFVSVMLLVYLLILFEPKDPEGARRIAATLRAGRIGSAVSAMPLWLLSFAALALVTAVGIVLIEAGVFDGDRMVEGWAPGRFLLVELIAGFLFVTRDVLIVQAFGLSRESREGAVIAFVVLFVLYGALPFIAIAGQLFDLLPVFWPLGDHPATLALGPVAAEVAAMALVLWWRWAAYWRRALAGPAAQAA